MSQYWCVNFDSEACLKYGIKHGFWMMQYQYEDSLGNLFQGGNQKSATTANWKRLTQIQIGDWFVAYLPKARTTAGNTFFAVGRACKPRKSPKSGDQVSTVAEYVSAQRSHEYKSGVIHYKDAPAFYEDFDDKWRSDDPLVRYAQRVDVESWKGYVASGIPWLSELDIPPYEIQRAFFKITKKSFDKIATQLAVSNGQKSARRKRQNNSTEIVDKTVVDALEKCQAKSQGFMLDSELRSKLEEHSMASATRHFESLGYTVEDVSKNHPYDLKCIRKHETLYIEVKGTQTDGKGIILTNGEVEFACRHSEKMVLFILHSIHVSQGQEMLSNGVRVVIHPWIVEEAALNPLAYKYEVPNA